MESLPSIRKKTFNFIGGNLLTDNYRKKFNNLNLINIMKKFGISSLLLGMFLISYNVLFW
jgi:hypothetical protein